MRPIRQCGPVLILSLVLTSLVLFLMKKGDFARESVSRGGDSNKNSVIQNRSVFPC